MKSWNGSHWTSYFYSGSVAFILSWVIAITVSGCRLGNREVDAPPPDPYTGYYATATQNEKVSATYTPKSASAPQTFSGMASPTLIPVDMQVEFWNPVLLQYYGPENAINVIDPLNSNLGYGFGFDSASRSFSGGYSYGARTLWNDSNCTYTETLTITGSLTPLGLTPNPMTAMGVTFNLSGRMAIDAKLEYKFLPSVPVCSPSLQAMYNCLQDQSTCAGSTAANQQANYDFVNSVFQTAIQSGVMTEADIQTASDVTFEADYQ